MKLTIIRNAKVHTEMPVYHLQDRNLSLRAMGLLTKMLALPDDWDFSINGLASICRDGVGSVRSALKELEENGYIIRMNDHAGNGRFQRVTYIIYEVPQKENAVEEHKTPAEPKTSVHEAEEPPEIPVENSKTEPEKPSAEIPYSAGTTQIKKDRYDSIYNINQSISIISPGKPNMEYSDAVETVRENIEYPVLLERYPQKRLDMIVDLAAEVLCSASDTVLIGKERYPYSLVKDRFMRIGSECVEYIFDCLDRTQTEIRCIKAYLLKTLFNAPATMEDYYQTKVNAMFPGLV